MIVLITSMYKHAYFVGLIFAVHESTVKTAIIGPLINFPLRGNLPISYSNNENSFTTNFPGL